ncbi:histidine kinase [Kitasatospora sp. MMS16-BH015]|nr:histidine kinase [Kitasatospora sp. MMS16-BH015]
MTKYIADPVLWALVLVLVAGAAIVVRQRRAALALRQEIDGLKEHYSELEHSYAQSVAAAQEQADEATKTVLKSAMRTLQGLAAEQQLILSRLQGKYGESAMLQDLLEVDHTNSQFGRRAQSVAVLCGGWLGRHRDPASVYDVVRSAQGRIRQFRRVEILSQVDFGISSRAVEPVALALAELLDNATSYSSPDTVVEINIRTVPKGVVIVVDDAGVGMNDEERARAEKLLTSERVTGVAGLGNPPQFGLAVIGVLCERFGFEVAVDSSSPYGGVRAVLLLPHELLTGMPEKPAATPGRAAQSQSQAQARAEASAPRRAEAPVAAGSPVGAEVPVTGYPTGDHPVALPSAPAALPARVPAIAAAQAARAPQSAEAAPAVRTAHAAQPAPAAAAEHSYGSYGSTADGLPMRRRKQRVAALPQAEPEPAPAPVATTRSGEQTAAIMGAFQRGTRSGRVTPPAPPQPEHTGQWQAHPDQQPAHAEPWPSHPDQQPAHPEQQSAHPDQWPNHTDQQPTHADQWQAHPDQAISTRGARSSEGHDFS